MIAQLALLAGGAAALVLGAAKGKQRLDLSRAKHRSLAGHVRWAKRIAARIPCYGYDERVFFRSDGAAEAVAQRREAGFAALAALYAERFPKSRALTAEAKPLLSDLQFIDAFRVPYQYCRLVHEHLGTGSFIAGSDGVLLTDLDGNQFYDLAGSYGVNLFGYDFYKACIDAGADKVRALGPVLGVYHPVVADNARRIAAIAGKEEISFHMSGTEAVMQAVRLVRYHSGRRRIVRFAGAYHGWWGEVQPGIGNPIPARDTLTLADMSDRTLEVLSTRGDIACVLVNPLQALHPNASAPGDSTLVDSARRAGFDRAAYGAWLARLRDVCTQRGIILIFDEIFVGFRLARGGAQEYFGVSADLVTYGKTLGGGLPVGVLAGSHTLMKRWSDERPADFNFARGTFHSHPYVMGAMNAFLERLDTPELAQVYQGLDPLWDGRASDLNGRLEAAALPVRVANLSSIWTVTYTRPSRYNWMLQYYLRAEGLALSWTGTGRFIFSLNYDDADFAEVARRFIAAAEKMRADGWWDGPETTNKAIRRTLLREMLAHRRRG